LEGVSFKGIWRRNTKNKKKDEKLEPTKVIHHKRIMISGRCRKIGDFKWRDIHRKNSERYIRKKNPNKEVLPDF